MISRTDSACDVSLGESTVVEQGTVDCDEQGGIVLAEKAETGDNPRRDSARGPAAKLLEYFRVLRSDYGIRFLILISLTVHLLKGFCRAQSQQSVRFLLQEWSVPGPKVDTYTSVIDIPWSMKPLVAIVSDMFPLLGYKKMPYIGMATVIGLVGICIASFMSPDSVPVQVPVLGLFLGNFSWMTADILVEGLFARRMAEHPKSGPDFVVFISIGQQVAYLLSSVISGSMLENIYPNGAQWNVALCLIPTALALYPVFANYGGEERTENSSRKHLWSTQRVVVVLSFVTGFFSLLFAFAGVVIDTRANFALCISILVLLNGLAWALFSPTIGNLVLFLGIVSGTNMSISGPAQYFYTDTVAQYPEGPHFTPYFYVTVCGIVGAVMAIFAMFIYAFFKTVRYRSVYIVLILLNAVLSAPNSILFSRINKTWGLSDHLFVGADTAIQTAIGALFFAPGLLLLARVCPDQVESSMFAILAANTNLAMTANGPISGYICESLGITPNGSLMETEKFKNMWIANLIMVGLKLVPLAFVFLLPKIKMTESLTGVRESVTTGSPYARLVARFAKTHVTPSV